MTMSKRAKALAMYDSYVASGIPPETSFSFSDAPLAAKPSVQDTQHHYTTFVVNDKGVVIKLDLALPFAGIYSEQKAEDVRRAFVAALDKFKYVTIFGPTGTVIGSFGFEQDQQALSDEEKAESPPAPADNSAANKDRRYRLWLLVGLVVAIFLVAAAAIASAAGIGFSLS
ncbi:hypothetical protein [Medusavirus stheno T3]|uniref:Uncharacterized protein n=1 Tax=Medusavirus stheno T3 TaxID=3069717 RepID=A0A7S7YG46_9VIRU|nr:hypothetical protein QKU73_gp258 [Acanthamoeba castellanii medusavirus]QPB44517.1 hypothetical protein [Medusavirus stheno T3]